jgi:hypothetical protein
VPDVVCDDAAGGRVIRELHERFIIGIGQNGKPTGSELPFFGTSANGIEQGIDVCEGEAKFRSMRFEDFLVFVEEVIAENGAPAVLRKATKTSNE